MAVAEVAPPTFEYSEAVVQKTQKATAVMTLLTLRAPHVTKGYDVPGQYVAVEGNDGNPLFFTFLNPPSSKTLQMLIKTESRLGHMITRGQTTLKMSDIQGTGIPFREIRGRKVLVLTMGTGAAPFLALVKHLQGLGRPTEGWQWVHGLKQPDHLALKPQWTALEKAGIELNLAYSAHQGTPPTRVQAMLYQMPPLNARTMMAMVCGSQEMMTSVRQILLAKGFTQDQIVLLGEAPPPPVTPPLG